MAISKRAQDASDQPRGEGSDTSIRRRTYLTEKDLHDLYNMIKGSRSAGAVYDAEAMLAQEDFEQTLQTIRSAKEHYAQSHRSVLRRDLEKQEDKKADEKQTQRLKRKQEKYQQALDRFDDVIVVLEGMVKRQRRSAPKTAPKTDPPPVKAKTEAAGERESPAILPPGFRDEFEKLDSQDAELEVLRKYFTFKKVRAENDIQPKSLYYLRNKHNAYLMVVADGPAPDEMAPLLHALTGKKLKSLPKAEFLELGKKRRLVRLAALSTQADMSSEPAEEAVEEKASSDPRREGVIDMGDFTQLFDAARRSGLVPGADTISHVRDREFRLNDYQKAFQIIEALYGKFSAASTQRQQRLRREDREIASGIIQMSPRKLMEKRARDNAETQNVDRARHRFMRVMEGLRILMRTEHS